MLRELHKASLLRAHKGKYQPCCRDDHKNSASETETSYKEVEFIVDLCCCQIPKRWWWWWVGGHRDGRDKVEDQRGAVCLPELWGWIDESQRCPRPHLAAWLPAFMLVPLWLYSPVQMHPWTHQEGLGGGVGAEWGRDAAGWVWMLHITLDHAHCLSSAFLPSFKCLHNRHKTFSSFFLLDQINVWSNSENQQTKQKAKKKK